MKLTKNDWFRAGRWMGLSVVWMALGWLASAQAVSTTTVQGTVYLANGQPGSGTLIVSWPAFTTASNQAVAADSTTVTIAPDGFLSVNLAPNLGATPAGLYYTAVYQMSDGSTSTEYWVVPAAASASIGQVRAQLMPAAQAVQAVSKSYVDQAIAEQLSSQLTASGGTLTGPLYLCCNPTQPLEAADKSYVDASFSQAVPLSGANMTGPLGAPSINGVQAPATGSPQTTLQSAMTSAGTNGALAIPPNYTGTDGFTNPNGVYVSDLRRSSSQQYERSVKEFGAVCDGTTDDTNALQAAINYAQTNGVALSIPQGTCKTHTLSWHGESIGGMSKQVSALKGFPGQDVLASAPDSTNLLSYTRIHDLTIYVDQSVDISCSAAEGRATAGSCTVNRPMEVNSIFSAGGSGLNGVAGTGAAWAVGNCAIAMPAATGAGGNGLREAEIENLEIVATGTDPLAQYTGAHSTHICGLYLAQWPQWSEFRNIDIRGLNTGIAIGAPSGGVIPSGLTADSNRWQNITMLATHGLTTVAGTNNILDNVVVLAVNSAATDEPPTGLVLNFAAMQQGWTVRNTVVMPAWDAVLPNLTVAASGGAVTAVTVGPEHGLGFDPYGVQIPVTFSGACTAHASANVNSDGSIGSVTITAGGAGCSTTTTASLNVAGTWDTAAALNQIDGQNMTFFGGNLLNGNGGYTVWNAAGSQSYGAQLGGGGTLPGGGIYPALLVNDGLEASFGFTGSANNFQQLGLIGGLKDNGLGNTLVQSNASGSGETGIEPARLAANTVSADFALLGAGNSNQAFASLNDLFLSAEDLLWTAGESGGTGSQFGKDSLAPVTGSYVKAIGGAWDTSGVWHVRGIANSLVLGKNFPVGSGSWYIAVKADTPSTQELKLTGNNGSGTTCTFADKTVSLTTSWQVFSVPYNTVTGNPSCDNATSGNPVTAAGLAPGTSTNVETAWLSFVPAFQSILIAQSPTQANQAATKGYVDQAITNQITNGSGVLSLAGGTLTGPLTGPEINGTTNCALSSSVSACISSASSALIPPGTTGTYTQGNAITATTTCVYDLTRGGLITQVNPGALGIGYTTAPTVSVNNTGTGGTGLAVTANVTSGQISSYTITNGGSGYTNCPVITIASPSLAPNPIPVLDQRRGTSTYSTVVRVDDFGCAADGVTDDTQCINNAIAFATKNGTSPGTISFTANRTYYVAQVTGYMPTGADDGSAPASGDTCAMSNAAQHPPIAGSACVPLTPETPGQLGFSIRVPDNLTIYGNSATLKGAFGELSTTFTLAPPYIAMFGAEQQYVYYTVRDLNIAHAFIGWACPEFGGEWQFHNVNTNTTGISILANVLQLSTFRDINFSSMAGIIVGGWWQCRAASQCPLGTSGDFADNILLDGYQFFALAATTPSGGVVANQNGLDTWFNTYFFHVGDNSTRMTDSQYAQLGADKDSFWRGIFGIGIAYYSRYQRSSNADEIRNYVDKVAMSYPIVITTPNDLLIDSMAGENTGDCEAGEPWGTPGICPNPYDPVNNQLEADILFQTPAGVVIRNVEGSGIDAEEVVGESWRNSTSQTLSSLRSGVNSSASRVASRFPVTNIQPQTDRTIHSNSNISNPNGSADSGEECFSAYGTYASGSTDGDEWCLRYALSTYSGTAAMPRYFVLEDEYGGSHFTGSPAVQVPGLRVRPGAISSSDTTLAVTDFSSQAFTISGGTVNGNSCAAISGVVLPGALISDGVLFVQAPSTVAPLQLTGNITSSGTMSLSFCNPTTATAIYPSGTYTAFLLDGAVPSATPSSSGGTPSSSSPLTTTVGDLVATNNSGAPGRLAGSTAAQTAILTQTGTGSVSAIPAWQTAPAFNGSNLTNLSGSNLTTGTVAIANGGTGASSASQALANLGGANLSASQTAFSGGVTGLQLGAAYQVDQFTGADFGAKLAACVGGLNASYGGTCDARNFTGSLSMGSNLTISTANATILLPCATISTSNQVIVTAGTRNVSIRGCSLRGASTASGSQGGTIFLYSGTSAMIQVGDPTYAADTMGFHLDNVLINITNATSASAQGLVAYRTQEMDLESLYFLGNQNQTGLTLDGTGNYTGGTFYDNAFNGFQTAVNAIGHQISNPATTDWMNASTFVRLHIDCPTSGGSPISGTYGVNLAQGDGNTFTGGDVEGCNTALHLGLNAQNNTFTGVRNENSNNQIIADTGSQFNSWITGGTMFTGKLTDNGSRNSFLDAFHRTFNGINGDWYASQQDATVTNHLRLGIGAGNVRGMYWESQVDQGTSSSIYNWQWGLTDGTSGQSNWVWNDLINNTTRIQLQENNTAGNNGTAINGTGTGSVCFECSANSGTGGVAFSSGGATPTTVGTVDSSGDAYFDGTLQSVGQATIQNSVEVKNNANVENDFILWAGSSAAQKESLIYKNYLGASQWYMVNNTTNDWALNSAISGVDSFKAYQSTNSSDTYVDASNTTGVVRVNYETGSGTAFKIYGGSSSSLYAAFTGTTLIQFPGLAASSGFNCLQVDNSGFVTNTGASCGSGSGAGVSLTPSATQVISQPIGTTLGITSANDVFYVDGYPSGGCTVGSTVYTTQLDCALATISNWLQTANENAVLIFGEKSSGAYYDTCTGITIPQFQNRSLSLIGYGTGGINQPSVIRQTCPINEAMLFKGDTPASYLNASIKISGLVLYGAGNASSCMSLSGLQGSVIENVFCNGGFTDSGGEDAIATFGADSSSLAWIYETTFRNIVVSGAPTGLPSTMATVTANVSGGNIATNGYTVSAAGAGYTSSPNPPIVYLWGNGAGAQPCTTMPTGLTATVSSGGIASVTSATAGSGCSGTINVEIFNDSVFLYGAHFKNVTDAETENVVVRGGFKGASMYEEGAPMNNLHAHVYSGQYASFEDKGGVVWDSAQIDTTGHIGFYVNGEGTTIKSPLISNNGDFPNGIGVLLGSSATDVSVVGSFFCYPNNVSSGWVKVATVSGGPVTNGQAANSDLNLFGSGTCDSVNSPASNLAGATLQELPTNTATSSSNYPSNNLALSDSWWNGTGVQGGSWSINSSHQGGTTGTENFNISSPAVSGFTGGAAVNVTNSTAATSSQNMSAPGIAHAGSYWNGTASSADTWTLGPSLGTGTTPSSTFALSHSGSSGTASVSIPYPTTVSSLTDTGLTSAAVTGTNGSGQLVSAATTGSGSVVLTASPTFTGNTTTLANNSASTDYLVIQPGTSSTAELGGVQLNSAAATPVAEWDLEEDTSYDFLLQDQGATTPMSILTGYINAGTNLSSQGTGAVTVNNVNHSGSGGFIVYEGGTNYNTAAFTVTSSGNASVTGTLTSTGTITGGMGVSLSSATSIAATSFTTTGLVLPAIPVSTTKRGMCVLIWEQNTAVGTVQFGMGMNNAPTDLWAINQDSPGTYKAPTYTTITSATTTAISAADAPSATATGYRDEIMFTLTTGSSNTVTATVYGLSSSTSDALVIEPGSYCTWLP